MCISLVLIMSLYCTILIVSIMLTAGCAARAILLIMIAVVEHVLMYIHTKQNFYFCSKKITNV